MKYGFVRPQNPDLAQKKVLYFYTIDGIVVPEGKTVNGELYGNEVLILLN